MLYRLRCFRLPALLVALHLLAACTTSTVAPSAAIRADRFAEIVTTFASPAYEGRDAGTAGIDMARDDIAAHFQALHLRPVFDQSFTQPFDVSLGVQAVQQALQFTFDDGETLDAEPHSAFSPLGFSGQGMFKGSAVFAGYGITNEARGYDSYADAAEHVRGKVVIVYRYEPRDTDGRSIWRMDAQGNRQPGWTRDAEFASKVKRAAAHGAAAVLIVNPPSADGGSSLVTPTRSAGPAEAAIPVMHISGELFRKVLQRAGRKPLETMRVYEQRANEGKPLTAQGVDVLEGVRIRGTVKLDRPSATVSNVAAYLPGRGALARQVVIVSAHYDHIGHGEFGSLSREHKLHPGADDNASGVAAMLLAADALAQRAKHSDADRRGVLFVAFAGEERGLLGSGHFVDNLPDITALHPAGLRRDQIAAMVNMDMVGRLREDKLIVLGVATATEWRELVKAAAATHGMTVTAAEAGSGRSDDLMFTLKKIPAIHLFTGVHEDYHRPSDTAEKINSEGGARITAMVCDLVDVLATQPRPPTFTQPPPAENGAIDHGHGARLGIMPNYAARDTPGCVIERVMPGGAAAKADMRDGDIITAWNAKPIENLHDLMTSLAEHKPGDEVTLTVQRGDETVELNVTLGSR